MTSIDGAVGIRGGTLQVANGVADQAKIIGLLSTIPASDGGKAGVWLPPPAPGPIRQCPREVAVAIHSFQEFWRSRGDLQVADGVVDRNGATLRKMDELAARPLVGPNGMDPGRISFRQTNPAELVAERDVTQMVISPVSFGGKFQEIAQTGTIREFLFEMRKDGAVYWIGVAVPRGTFDFSRIQVYFHPTVVQGGVVYAAESDYPTFRRGWSDRLQRYVAMQGGQLAGARSMPLIVPFMTMAAFRGTAPSYMFANRPVETLNAIMTAVRDECSTDSTATVEVKRVGVSSFSSGIGALRLFVRTFSSSGLIVETTDYDSPFIVTEPKALTRAPNAVARLFTQVPPSHVQPGWVTMSATALSDVRTFTKEGAHAKIGWMTYYSASLVTVV